MAQAQCSTTAVLLTALAVVSRPTTSHRTSVASTQTFRAVHPQTVRVALSAVVSLSERQVWNGPLTLGRRGWSCLCIAQPLSFKCLDIEPEPKKCLSLSQLLALSCRNSRTDCA